MINKLKTSIISTSAVPDMHGVRIPSPSTMEVPSMVMNKMEYFIVWFFSSMDFTKDALLSRRFGTSSR